MKIEVRAGTGPDPGARCNDTAMDGAWNRPPPKPYKFTGFGGIHGPKPYEFIGFGGMAPNPIHIWCLVASV